ncbi:MAG: hypothetical protein WBO92_03160 [Candidatus Moraniibacteriota bacterium]
MLESIVRSGELDGYAGGVIEAVLRLGVQQNELSQSAPRVLALIPETIATSTRRREQLDETMQKMAAALDAAKQKYDEDVAALMRRRMELEALLFHYQEWQKAQSVIKVSAD